MLVDGSAPARVVAGVPVAPLFDRPGRWAWLPGPPRLVPGPDGPGIRLLRAPPDEDGPAGLLVLTVDLGWSEEALRACAAALAEETGDPDALAGPVRLADARAGIFEVTREVEGTPPLLRPLGALRARLDAPHTVVLHAALDAAGPRLVEAALRSRTLPLGIRYTLDLPVLRAGRGLRVTVDWGRVYDHFSTHTRVGLVLGTAEVRRLTERLIEEKVVAITAVAGVEDEKGGAMADALAWVERTLVRQYCTPMLALDREPATASLGDAGELFAVGSAEAVEAHGVRERSTTVFDLQRPEPVIRTLPAQALLGDLVRGVDVDAIVLDLRTSDPLFFRRKRFTVDTAQALADFGIVELLGTWTWGGTAVAMRLGPDAPEATCSAWLDAAPERRWSLDLDVRFAADAPTAPGDVVRLPTITGQGDQLRLDLVEVLGLRRVELVWPGAAEGLLAVRARLTVQRGEEVREAATALLRADAPRAAVWARDLRAGDIVRVEPTWLLDSGVLVGEPLPVVGAVTPIPAPIRWWTVELVAEADWAGLDRVTLTLEPLPDGAPVVVQVAGPDTRHAARLSSPSGTARRYRYRTTRTWADGRVAEDLPVESDLPLLLVGKVAANVLQVEFRPIGPELPQAGLRAVEIELLYVDAPNRVRHEERRLVRALADRSTWTVPLSDPSVRQYEYRLTWHRLDGSREVGAWTRTADRLVPIPIR